jgi:MerR family mercuric resistance operon transcriptional regulator
MEISMYGIGTAAKLSGVGIETIRYYEREGVIPPAERSASGRRLYSDAAIARLRFVKRLSVVAIFETDGVLI